MDDQAARAALERLIDERREDYAGLSRLLGRNPAYVQQYVRRGTPRRLAEADRRTLAAYFGVAEEELGGPPRPAPRRGTELVSVPRLELGASAGSGALADDDSAGSPIGLPLSLLRELGAGRSAALSMIRVAGDSMLPTLADGDDILVDGDDGAGRLREGVYVLRLDDALMVKRLAVGPDGTVSVTSDNPVGPRWTVAADVLRVVGRVIWAGRRIR